MRYQHLTLERLKEALDYDPATGIFRWKVRPFHNSRKRPGDVAGTPKVAPNGRNYRVIGIDGRAYQATQLAFFYVHGRWARGQVGQANGIRDDLRAENLIELQTTSGKHDLTTREGRARYQRDYWDTNADYRRQLAFKRNYGITVSEYQEMLDAQGGRCAVCALPEKTVIRRTSQLKWLSVDHDHETGAVRQLLCRDCNSGLGNFKDEPDLLERAAAYLRRHKAAAAAVPAKEAA